MITALIWCAVAAVLLVFTYTLGMYLESAGTPVRRPGPVGGYAVVFLVPCLNEERVIGETLRRLTALSPPDGMIIVIDDGSDDGTADVVRGFPDARVDLLRRDPPNARQGKGEALNEAVRHLLDGDVLDRLDEDRTVVCLVDADGRLDEDSLAVALPCFEDPDVGAVQTGVRIGNRRDSVLARLQDMEFVLYGQVFQRTRGRIGSAGLGGNGQFVRLSALLGIGPAPWSRGLTEDLDLGIRIVLSGRRSLSIPHVAVHQQGLVRLSRLLRQRSRWFQGHLQAWRLVPSVVARSSGRTAADLLHVLFSPLLIFVGSFMTMSLVASLAGAVFSADARHQLLQPVPIVSWYVLTFAPAFLFGPVYARVTGELRSGRGLLYGHLFVLYGLTWLVAGWWGLGRTLAGRRTWLKTERLTEARSRETAPPVDGRRPAQAPAVVVARPPGGSPNDHAGDASPRAPVEEG
jgi:1,2-diacylglycerol 3-beta-glucosyltransferase